MKKLYIFLVITLVCFGSCVKDAPFFSDLTKGGAVADLPLSGISYFTSDALPGALNFVSSAGDTIRDTFVVNIASINTLKSNVTIGIGVDLPKIDSYHTYDTSLTYLPIPTASYVINTPTVTIPAGQRQARAVVTFYKQGLDGGKNYMLPISITTAPGLIISGNFGTHYFHFIGNPLIGTYHSTGTFTRLGVTRAIDQDKGLSAINATTLICDFADLGSSGYQMLIQVNPDNTLTITKAGQSPDLTSTGVNVYDPSTKSFTINQSYGGGTRVDVERISFLHK